MAEPRATPVVWDPTGDPHMPYRARVAEQEWLVHLGELPAEPLYTLTIDGAEVESFDTWPEVWARPGR